MLLAQKIRNSESKLASKKRKLYYFSPFEQFIEDESMQVESIDPSNVTEPTDAAIKTKIEKTSQNKQSDPFKQRKKDLESKGQTSFASRSILGLPFAFASATTIPDTFVPGASTAMC